MEFESQPTQPPKSNLSVLVVIIFVLLAAAIGWLFYRIESVADEQNKAATTEQDEDITPSTDNGWNTVVKSGSGGFHVTLPDGWGPITRDLKSDFIILPGTAQPTVVKGSEVEINDVEGYGTDSLSVFSMVMLDKGTAAAPQGTASDFTIGKGETAITGKKYIYTYPKDQEVGIGFTRFAGDRDYEYVFTSKDQELHVYYSVFGSDPRNLSATVDEIVRTVTINTNQVPATR